MASGFPAPVQNQDELVYENQLDALADQVDTKATKEGTLDADTLKTGYQTQSASGLVDDGDAAPVWQSTLEPDETFYITQASLQKLEGEAAPDGVDLIIGDLTDDTAADTAITGDGTDKNDVTGDPLASYTNSNDSGVHIAVLIDNGNYNAGSGSAQSMMGAFIGRFE